MALATPTPTPTLTILLIALLATTTLAHNHFPHLPLPASCTGNPTLLKCALDFELALKAAASAQFHISPAAISVVLDSVNAARAAGLSIIHVLSTMDASAFLGAAHHSINLMNTLNSTIGVAVGELIKASAGLEGGAKLSLTQLQCVGKSLKLASKAGAKLSVCTGLKPAGSMISSNVLLSSLIKQFISLTDLSLKVVTNVQAAAKISL